LFLVPDQHAGRELDHDAARERDEEQERLGTPYVQNGRLTVSISSGIVAINTPITVPAGSGGSLPA
jgi:hypothetical protein